MINVEKIYLTPHRWGLQYYSLGDQGTFKTLGRIIRSYHLSLIFHVMKPCKEAKQAIFHDVTISDSLLFLSTKTLEHQFWRLENVLVLSSHSPLGAFIRSLLEIPHSCLVTAPLRQYRLISHNKLRNSSHHLLALYEPLQNIKLFTTPLIPQWLLSCIA